MSEHDPGFSTRAVGGWNQISEVKQHPASPPLYQAATFIFDDMDDFASVAQTKISGGYLYSRWANPTVDMLGRVVASLEGAEATACFASGMGAIAGTLFSLLSSGDHLVAASQLYGGTHGLFGTALARAGISVTTIDVGDHVHGCDDVVELPSLAELLADVVVPALLAEAGRNQIADAGETGEGQRIGSEPNTEAG